jgi:hypothetical protein
MRNCILALCLAAAIAVANPIAPVFLNEVGSDTIRGQWVEICNSDTWPYNLRGILITTSLSCCTLECAMGLVVDSAVLARGDSAHGTFRFNPAGDSINFSLWHEWVKFPSLPAGPNSAPAFPANTSICHWPWGSVYFGECWYVDSTPTPGLPNDDWSAISGTVAGLPPAMHTPFIAQASGPAACCAGYASGTFYIGGLSPGRYEVTVEGLAYNGVTYHGVLSESVEVGYAQTVSGIEVIMDNWTELRSLPSGDSSVGAGNGACLASLAGRIYALKGGRTCEFYCYDTSTCTWRALAPIPSTGRLGTSKAVGKGATLCAASGKLYATKGSGTDEFWAFTPDNGQGSWTQRADVPSGLNHPGAGASSTSAALGATTWVYLLKGAGTNELCRYNTETDSWELRTGPPLKEHGRPFRAGSSLTSDGSHHLYALKGGSDESFVCDLLTSVWSSLPTLPLKGRGNHRRLAGSGAGLVYVPADTWSHPLAQLFALKGRKSLEFWHSLVRSPEWKQLDDVPRKQNKKVGAGGALTVCNGTLYALKGSRTLEFYSHTPDPTLPGPPELNTARPSTEGIDRPVNAQLALSISPNPASSSLDPLVSYSVPMSGSVQLTVHDITGRRVAVLTDGQTTAGRHSARINTTELRPGVYLVRLQTRTGVKTAKFVKE